MKKYNADKIAIAHHQNDQAETFLYRVVRGTGIYGAGAMREKDGNLIRPLLCVKKEEIVKYLKEAGQAWVEDASNQDDAFARNQIRNQVIPRLEMINEQAVEHIGWLCEDIKEVTTYLTRSDRRVIFKMYKAYWTRILISIVINCYWKTIGSRNRF